jgi:hypothetical protein
LGRKAVAGNVQSGDVACFNEHITEEKKGVIEGKGNATSKSPCDLELEWLLHQSKF